MYHVANNFFVGRHADNSVRMLKFDQTPDPYPHADAAEFYDLAGRPLAPRLDLTVDPETWASLVAGTSALGQNAERVAAARAFHTALA